MQVFLGSLPLALSFSIPLHISSIALGRQRSGGGPELITDQCMAGPGYEFWRMLKLSLNLYALCLKYKALMTV